LIAILAVGLGACDLTSRERALERKTPAVDPDSAALSYSHMPMGSSLPDPGAVPLSQKVADPSAARSPGAKKTARSEPSPYGCYLASRPYTEEVRFRSIYLRFPKGIVKRAGEETERLTFRLRAVRTGDTDTTGVRYAHCVVPRAEGVKSIASNQVIRDGENQAVREAFQPDAQAYKAKGGCGYVKVVKFCDSGGCNIVSVTTVDCEPSGGGGGDSGGDSGGNTSGGSGGSSDDRCGSYPCDDSGSSGGGDFGDSGDDGQDCEQVVNPPPGSSCAPDDPEVSEKKRCPSDPLKDMDIRATCAGIEGGRFGEEARQYPDGTPKPHWGLDLGGRNAEIGTEITPVEGGTVVAADAHSPDFGNYVIIRNNDTWYLYAHLSKVTVEGFESVDPDDKIGEMGKSGNAAEADCNPVHLHLEVRKDKEKWPTDDESKRKDPEKYVGTEFSDNGRPVSDNC
jgi:hypothetical protein